MLKKYLSWINSNLLFILSTFLIAFIPLFPKIPLFDILPGYIVRIRAEDFLILLAAIIWLRDNKITRIKKWQTSFFWLIVAYAIVGLTSVFLGVALLQSIPFQLIHIGKSALHFFRYMEYFSLFFFLYSSVKTKQHIKIILITMVITLVAVVGYGFGQEYSHFPLYSTMNREYSKGQKLYLQANARPQSTFAGHYDLGAYLVIVLPIIFALSINNLKIKSKTKARLVSLSLHLIHLSGAWMLVTSGSKTALAAYFTAILIVSYFHLKKLGNLKQKLKWIATLIAIVVVVFAITLTFFGQETESAFLSIANQNTFAHKIISKIPGVGSKLTQNQQSDASRPDDLYGDGHEFKTVITTDEYGNETKKIVTQKSTWSENALKYGISMGIRLDTLWPNAVKGLINNPLFGNGYATLSSIDNGQFTEADSTDNNFLRTLGETGFLGFITFYGLIIFILNRTYKNTKNKNPLIATFNIGFTGSIIGLLINATYIDVFAASKVAFTFWAFAGISIKSGLIPVNKNPLKLPNDKTLFVSKIWQHLIKHRSIYISFLILFFLFHKNPYAEHSLLRSFEVSNKAIENLVTTKCFVNTGSFSVCSNNGLVLKNNPNIYSLLLVPFLILNSKPTTFYYLNILLLATILLITYKIIDRNLKNQKNSSNSSSIKITSLLIMIFIFYLTSATSAPLTNNIFLVLIIVAPIFVIKISSLLLKQKKLVIQITRILSIILISSFFYKTNGIAQMETSFRNNQISYKDKIMKRLNVHFDNKNAENKNKKHYLISKLNPYYLDLYKNDNYQTLPISETQPYFSDAANIWKDLSFEPSISLNNQNITKVDLLKTYKNIIENDGQLYLTDYDCQQNTKKDSCLTNFYNIKKAFDISYEVVDCNEQCNIYKVSKVQPKISSKPPTINNKQLILEKLSGNYSFSIFNNKFSPSKDPLVTPYNTISMLNNLKQIKQFSNQTFMIFTGDIIQVAEKSWHDYFNTTFANLSPSPILYNNLKNYNLVEQKYQKKTLPKYYKFFSDNEYFIFLDLNNESEIDDNQKLFVYNAFLELEKLPDIKNVFIIANNLDWQNTQDSPNLQTQTNFYYNLEQKLAKFPNLNKYVITSNHNKREGERNYQHQISNQSKTNYFANLTDNASFASFIQFNIDENSNVTFKEIYNQF